MSLHFRGPFRLKQLAVYMPSGARRGREMHDHDSGPTRRDAELKHDAHAHHHLHQHHRHQRRERHEAAVRCPLAWVTAIMDGQTVSWVNNYCPGYTEALTPTSSVISQSASNLGTAISATPTAAPSVVVPGVKPAAVGQFTRAGYYNAVQQRSDGLTFLGNLGGVDSGSGSSGKWTS